ncbi:MAG: RNA methyltransferase [Crocinitomicaceae bacterium]|nr:RNA methyltransferase [Crocinitomicaceae bacterium]
MCTELLQNQSENIVFLAHLNSFKPSEIEGEIVEVSSKELEQLSLLKTPNLVLAIVKKPSKRISQASTTKLTLALDGVQDPGNLGTILRIADWFGIETIICSKETVDCFNPKVVQASMGAVFRVHCFYTDLSMYLKNVKVPIYGADLNGDNLFELKALQPGVIVMGNEGNGLSTEVRECIQQKLMIPKFGNAESLNVAVATGIIVSAFFNK